jgi:hypothetical protein
MQLVIFGCKDLRLAPPAPLPVSVESRPNGVPRLGDWVPEAANRNARG